MNFLVCPTTKKAIEKANDYFKVSNETITYPSFDGIPNLLVYPEQESMSEKEELCQLVKAARTDGWSAALSIIHGDKPGFIQYVTDQMRLIILDLLPISPDHDVLEIGHGLGQFSVELARRSRQVSFLEIVPGQASFTALRLEQSAMTKFEIAVGGNDCSLPYSDNSFDSIVANLVLEWCGARALRTPEESQRLFLKECIRCLKPGGRLLLSTKNRYGFNYLLGGTDEHSYGLRFGQALPRFVNSLRLRLRGHKRPAGWLHSYNQLTKICVGTGFAIDRTVWLVPEMRFPKACADNEPMALRQYRLSTAFPLADGRRRTRVMSFLLDWVLKHVGQGLTFVLLK